MRRNKGFTLIEILVVCAIIGILAGATIMVTGPSRAKARDSRRLSDMTQIQTALESYFAEQSRTEAAYPLHTSPVTISAAALQGMVPNHIAELPEDPHNGNPPYIYMSLNSGKGYCIAAKFESPNPQRVRNDSVCTTINNLPADYDYVIGR